MCLRRLSIGFLMEKRFRFPSPFSLNGLPVQWSSGDSDSHNEFNELHLRFYISSDIWRSRILEAWTLNCDYRNSSPCLLSFLPLKHLILRHRHWRTPVRARNFLIIPKTLSTSFAHYQRANCVHWCRLVLSWQLWMSNATKIGACRSLHPMRNRR